MAGAYFPKTKERKKLKGAKQSTIITEITTSVARMSMFQVAESKLLVPNPEVLRRVLIRFTSDVLLEKPNDVYEYMKDWAASHMKRSPDGVSSIEVAGSLVRLNNEIERLQTLMNKRLKYYRDICDGCQYHYLMALEDSEEDMFHLRHLDHQIHKTKEAIQEAQRQHDEVSFQIEHYLTTLETDQEKSHRIHQIYRRYYPTWKKDILISPRSRLAKLE